MALYVQTPDKRSHCFLWWTCAAFSAVAHFQGVKLFCVDHGQYEEVAVLDPATAREARHRIEGFQDLSMSPEEREKVSGAHDNRQCACSNPKHRHRR